MSFYDIITYDIDNEEKEEITVNNTYGEFNKRTDRVGKTNDTTLNGEIPSRFE